MADEELNAVPSITLDQDEIANRHVRRTVMPDGERPGPAPRGGPSVVLVALGAALLVLGFVQWRLYQSAAVTQKNLEDARLQIQQLESRLASTDTTITKSEVLLAEKLKSMDQQIDASKSEIRKLWGLAGDTQRKAIEQLKATNDQQTASLGELQRATGSLEQKASELKASLDQTTEMTRNSEASAREAVQRIELAQEKLTTAEADLKSLKQKQSSLEGDYSRRLSALEDTSKSTDVFRRNTQDELRKLKEELLRSNTPPAKPSL